MTPRYALRFSPMAQAEHFLPDRLWCFVALGALASASPAAAQDGSAPQDELAELRATIDRLSARIDALEAELAAERGEPGESTPDEGSKPIDPPPQIAFKGAPEARQAGGWSFKPRGRLQFDAGVIDAPDDSGTSGRIESAVRRVWLGASGAIPGGFDYRVEVDFAGNEVTVRDATIGYGAGDFGITIGHFRNFQSLEEMTSSLHTSFIERAAFTDAFGFERRLGVGVTWSKQPLLLQGGIFSDDLDSLPSGNWSADARAVFLPKIGEAQLHLGGSAHYRSYEGGSVVRYRQRPLVSFTDVRFIDTGNMPARSETSFGAEAAIISGPWHAAAEAYWQTVGRGLGFSDPTFFGGYAEVGYFLTRGDTRGYAGGSFDRIRPSRPIDQGGPGAIQFNLRYDRLDLAADEIAGGVQDGLLASLVWKPTDYTLLLANYGRLKYAGAVPTAPGNPSDFGVDVFAMRAQIDF